MKTTVKKISDRSYLHSHKFMQGRFYVSENEQIVLCLKSSNSNFEGVTILPGKADTFLGYHSSCFAESSFKPFCGTLEIEQI